MNIQNNLLETEKLRRTEPTLLQLPLSEAPWYKIVFGDKLSRQFKYKHHVVFRLFDGPKTQCMKDYIKPTLKPSQKQIILHCGTNNLPLSEDCKDHYES